MDEEAPDAAVRELCRLHSDYAEAIRALVASGDASQARVSSAPGDGAGRWIGPYRLLEALGEGGMGKVYLAEQREPVRRRVAVKVIREGVGDIRDLIARFEAERQALAMMDHPNIARVYEAGDTGEGQPYFVMELVRGVPITEYCDVNKLELPARIRLFQQVCQGVQHAHQKGVMHRDLKPSNVLVMIEGDSPRPKIIDFGLARAVESRLTDRTLHTEQGALLGTPDYMSPEQAGLSGLDVDTRTDVYSLGVMLYELLTGELPFDPRDLRSKGLAEMQQRIRDIDPPKPSLRLSQLRDPSTAAGRRRTEGRALVGRLRGDLDWITMMALEKDRTRRYQTPAALAEDLQNYLSDEPVAAGPPSTSYRLRKLLRRHRALVFTVALVILALALGLAIALWQYRDARANEIEAARRRDEFRQMLDVFVVDALIERADQRLWPPTPDTLGDFDAWLAVARDLADRVPAYRELGSVVAGEGDDEASPDLGQLLAAGSSTERVLAAYHEYARQSLDRSIQELTRSETGQIARIQRRRNRAASLASESVERVRPAWARAADAVRAGTRFSGLELVPQVGLFPLGPDPQSGLQEFAHLLSGQPPARDLDAGRLQVTEASGLVFVLLPGGEFLMGAQASDPDGPNFDPAAEPGESDSKGRPVKVRLAPFFMSKYEMTQEQWVRVAGGNPSAYQSAPGTGVHLAAHPVENVDWAACQRVAFRYALMLPSEAQWEYAARAGQDGPWAGMGLRLAKCANLSDRSLASENLGVAVEDWDDGHAIHTRIGSLLPNVFGLHDMFGNVSEWCRDRAMPYDLEPEDSTGWRTTAQTEQLGGRIRRGGDWVTLAVWARVSAREPIGEGSTHGSLGFRPVFPLQEND